MVLGSFIYGVVSGELSGHRPNFEDSVQVFDVVLSKMKEVVEDIDDKGPLPTHCETICLQIRLIFSDDTKELFAQKISNFTERYVCDYHLRPDFHSRYIGWYAQSILLQDCMIDGTFEIPDTNEIFKNAQADFLNSVVAQCPTEEHVDVSLLADRLILIYSLWAVDFFQITQQRFPEHIFPRPNPIIKLDRQRLINDIVYHQQKHPHDHGFTHITDMFRLQSSFKSYDELKMMVQHVFFQFDRKPNDCQTIAMNPRGTFPVGSNCRVVKFMNDLKEPSRSITMVIAVVCSDVTLLGEVQLIEHTDHNQNNHHQVMADIARICGGEVNQQNNTEQMVSELTYQIWRLYSRDNTCASRRATVVDRFEANVHQPEAIKNEESYYLHMYEIRPVKYNNERMLLLTFPFDRDTQKNIYYRSLNLWQTHTSPYLVNMKNWRTDSSDHVSVVLRGVVKPLYSSTLQTWTDEQLIQGVLDIAQGLAFLHSKGIRYHDVDDVMVDPNNHLKLSGVAGLAPISSDEIYYGTTHPCHYSMYNDIERFGRKMSSILTRDNKRELPPMEFRDLILSCGAAYKNRPTMSQVVSKIKEIQKNSKLVSLLAREKRED